METCENGPDPRCPNPEPAAGFIQAVVLHLKKPAYLELGRNTFANATYLLRRDVGENGTQIRVTSELQQMGSPPAEVGLTVNGSFKRFRTWTQGRIARCVATGDENTVLACSDQLDNDCDGAVDCADPDCQGVTGQENTAPACTDGIDNDCDGLIDCADSDCVLGAENTLAVCRDGVDNDCDGTLDCDDSDCDGTIVGEDTEAACTDGVDNDCDDLIDCADPDCEGTTGEENTEALCTDGVDNDCDDLIDCLDPDCEGTTGDENTDATCLDGVDNDCDNDIDCDDSECVAMVLCSACDPADYPEECPGGAVTPAAPDCPCTGDSLKIVFAETLDDVASAGTNYSHDSFVDGMSIKAWLVADVVTEPMDTDGTGALDSGLQGWSLGVAHDSDALELSDLTYDPGPALDAERGGFTLLESDDMETCANDPDPGCPNPEPASGYIQVVILHLKKPVFLPTGRSTFTNATYTLKRDVGPSGTEIAINGDMKPEDEPRVEIHLTHRGTRKQPRTIVLCGHGMSGRIAGPSQSGARSVVCAACRGLTEGCRSTPFCFKILGRSALTWNS